MAAVVLVIAAVWRYLPFQIHSPKQEFQLASTGYGQRSRITLPDSTAIILNANSTLRYPTVWTATTPRQFELKGEAYFEVSSRPEGPQHDLVVHTADGAVQVIGTRFVVYDRGQGTRVVVEEGGVEVAVADTISLSNIPVAEVQLAPGSMLQFRKGSRLLHPQQVKVGLHTTWWRDHLILEDTPFEQVIHRLEETYGIEVRVKDKLLLRRTLSGSIENRDLDVIVEALAKALRVPVHQEGQVVIFGHASEERRNP
jgi:ferric-dicitrate binding protein FerR (iron transport regulator)